MRTFPHAEIGVFVLQSTVNFWGYAVLADGQKIRVRAGSSDDGLIIEAGEPLAQEMKLLSVSTIEADGRRTYGEYEDEPIEEDQMGEEFVFEMAARFFGERLDQADDDSLFGAKLRRYDPIEVQRMAPRPAVQPEGSDKPWWKFW